ncbi:MAG: hypothetical protein ACOYNO_03835 [Saprospiraceae bacterium]
MQEVKDQLAHLAEIRSLMERSNRYLSLSGLSGVWAGCCALAGAVAVYVYLDAAPFSGEDYYYNRAMQANRWGLDYKEAFLLIGCAVLLMALAGGLYFTGRKARRKGRQAWDASGWRLVRALALPLVAGGVYVLGLLYWDLPGLAAPTTLVFYGLALINGSKYTVGDVGQLGIAEMALGLLGVFFIGHGLELWAFGFGFLHIVYGIWMYYRYDRN